MDYRCLMNVSNTPTTNTFCDLDIIRFGNLDKYDCQVTQIYFSKSSPKFCCHLVIRVPIIAGLECQGHSQVSDGLLMTVKMKNSDFGNLDICFLQNLPKNYLAAFSFFLQPLFGPANIYPIAEVEYDKLFTKKNRAEQLKQVKIYVTLRPGTFDQKLTKLYERANTLA